MNWDIKNIILGIIIAVVFLMFAVYGTKLIYDEPNYEDFCNISFDRPIIIKEPSSNCPQNFGEINNKTEECFENKGEPVNVYNDRGCVIDIKCDTCREAWDKVNEDYSKNLFIISIIISLIAIFISALFIQVSSVSGGLMLGSLFYLIYGTGRYWQYMNDWLRFVILGIALVILIYLGYKLAKKK